MTEIVAFLPHISNRKCTQATAWGRCNKGVNYTCHTSLSNPNKITMKKNNMDHKGATGISATAAGYAINAKPGPEEIKQHDKKRRPALQHFLFSKVTEGNRLF